MMLYARVEPLVTRSSIVRLLEVKLFWFFVLLSVIVGATRRRELPRGLAEVEFRAHCFVRREV